MPRSARARYGVNSGWWLLADILEGRTVHGDYVHGPSDFNPDTATFRGRWVSKGYRGSGYLPEEHRAELGRDAEAGPVFVVYSYGTPIGWYRPVQPGRPAAWTVPDVRYSVTTSKHQGRLRPAVQRAEDRAAEARRFEDMARTA